MSGIVKPITTLADVCAEADIIRLSSGNTLGDMIVSDIYVNAEQIARKVVTQKMQDQSTWDARLDDILTSRLFGYPIMLALLSVAFWITIEGANIPMHIVNACLPHALHFLNMLSILNATLGK